MLLQDYESDDGEHEEDEDYYGYEERNQFVKAAGGEIVDCWGGGLDAEFLVR
jgi:hypothetical protein